jgi:hypothetical protein
MVIEHAKNHLVHLPRGARIMGSIQDLSDGERIAACYLEAALTVLGGKGVDTSEVVIEWDDAMVEPT